MSTWKWTQRRRPIKCVVSRSCPKRPKDESKRSSRRCIDVAIFQRLSRNSPIVFQASRVDSTIPLQYSTLLVDFEEEEGCLWSTESLSAKEKHQLKHRELFLCRDYETYEISLIRSALARDVETVVLICDCFFQGKVLGHVAMRS